MRVGDPPLIAGEGFVYQVADRELEPVLDDDADDPQRRAPQAERILLAGRLLADAEHPGDRVQLVGKRHRAGDVALGKRTTGVAWPVVSFDRIGNDLRFLV